MVLAALGYGEHVTVDDHDPKSAARVGRILVSFTDALSARLVRGQLGFLLDAGFDVHVATAVAAGVSQPSAEDWARLRNSLDSGVVPHHVPFVREPSVRRDIRSLASAISLVRQLRPDLMVVSTPKAGLIGMAAAWICRVPIRVYTVRGFRFETMSGVRRRLYRVIEKMIMRCSHHVVFNSRSLRALAESEGLIPPAQGLIIGSGSGNGIDIQRFSPEHLPSRSSSRSTLGLPLDAVVIGFVGRLTADKGVDDLVDAFTGEIFSREFADNGKRQALREKLWLVIVGDQEPGDPLAPLTSLQLAEHPRIIRPGWLDTPEVVYPSFDVLAFPSYREGFPNVPLEAQLCGVPVVGYAATGTVDAVRNGVTGLLVPVGDRQALVTALETLLSDTDLRTQMGRSGSEWVRTTFDQRRLWTELADLYRRWLHQAREA